MNTKGQDKMSDTVLGALRSGKRTLIERDVKNEGASGDLYENKRMGNLLVSSTTPRR